MQGEDEARVLGVGALGGEVEGLRLARGAPGHRLLVAGRPGAVVHLAEDRRHGPAAGAAPSPAAGRGARDRSAHSGRRAAAGRRSLISAER